VLNADRPGTAVGAAAEDAKVTRESNQCPGGTHFFHDGNSAFRSITFADSADVNLHSGSL
jgi:hypothetical protein